MFKFRNYPAACAATLERGNEKDTQLQAKSNLEATMSKQLQTATLGAGCFWCVEAIFQEVIGVHSVVSGYTGGAVPNPSYQQICTGSTGHAEVTQITFDPQTISFADLLSIFWRVHDPTTLNRQGADVGTQYRSVIFYHSKEQKAIAGKSKQEADASGLWPKPHCHRNFPPDYLLPRRSLSPKLLSRES